MIRRETGGVNVACLSDPPTCHTRQLKNYSWVQSTQRPQACTHANMMIPCTFCQFQDATQKLSRHRWVGTYLDSEASR